MVKIIHIESGSPAAKAGLRESDTIISADGHILHDALDFMFYIEQKPRVEIVYLRGDTEFRTTLKNREFSYSGMEPETIGLRRCNNKCVFCFIDQQPMGMRKSLYVKDEDIRHSFLHGNYITATNTPEWEWERIIEQRMSPLYISVHATDEKIREKMLGNVNAPPIMPILERLASSNIGFHSQIVVVPDFNDGKILEKTVRDIYRLGGSALSCAIVPVGMTRYRKDLPKIEPVTPSLAARIIQISGKIRGEIDRPEFLQIADEMFLLAGEKIPEAEYYGDFPQLDNGVGIVRLTIDDAESYTREPICTSVENHKFFVDIITGTRAADILQRHFPKNLGIKGVERRIIGIKNRFWGDDVTAANLLTGKDIKNAVIGSEADIIFLPPNVLNAENLFLDNMSIDEIREAAHGEVVVNSGYLSDIQEVISRI